MSEFRSNRHGRIHGFRAIGENFWVRSQGRRQGLFVVGDGVWGWNLKPHLPPNFIFSSDFDHFILQENKNGKFLHIPSSSYCRDHIFAAEIPQWSKSWWGKIPHVPQWRIRIRPWQSANKLRNYNRNNEWSDITPFHDRADKISWNDSVI